MSFGDFSPEGGSGQRTIFTVEELEQFTESLLQWEAGTPPTSSPSTSTTPLHAFPFPLPNHPFQGQIPPDFPAAQHTTIPTILDIMEPLPNFETAMLPVQPSVKTEWPLEQHSPVVNTPIASSSKRKSLLTAAEKKANHLESERKRRVAIKDGLDELLVIVPALNARPESSKAEVLTQTIEYLKLMKIENEALRNEVNYYRGGRGAGG